MVPSEKVRVLVADDDMGRGRFLASHLARRGFDVASANSGEEALRVLRLHDPALVLLDLSTPGMSVLDTLERIKQLKPGVPVVMLSNRHDPDIVFNASKLGADDYLAKPFETRELDLRIDKVLEKQRIPGEVSQLRDQVRRNRDFAGLFGTSPRMEEVKNTIEQVADTTATVLIRGESGTGKEVVARMIYAQSATIPRSPLSRSTARQSRTNCWRVSCLVTNPARLLAPIGRSWESSI